MIGCMIKYYILTGLAANGMHEIIFGSYELEDVRFEQDEQITFERGHYAGYKALKIHKLDCDKQSAVDAKLMELNRIPELEKELAHMTMLKEEYQNQARELRNK